jgi:hypothetical protein
MHSIAVSCLPRQWQTDDRQGYVNVARQGAAALGSLVQSLLLRALQPAQAGFAARSPQFQPPSVTLTWPWMID